MGQLDTIVYLTSIFVFIFFIAYVLWRIIWFSQYGGKYLLACLLYTHPSLISLIIIYCTI